MSPNESPPREAPRAAPVSLPELLPNALARVASVDVETDDAIRLKSLGICVGRRVQMVKAGDPLVVRVLGARVGLSARIAAGVSVDPSI